MKYEPHNYQITAFNFLLERNYGALLLEPGLGKTSITLNTINALIKDNMINSVLIIAPLSVCRLTWQQEISKWDDFSHLTSVVLHGGQKEKLLLANVNIYIINPDGLEWLLGHKDIISKLNVNCLVIDELTKFKNISSKRFKLLYKNIDKFKYRYGLTGSPVANGLHQIFGQMLILDNGVSLGKYKKNFERQFFDTLPVMLSNGRTFYTISPNENTERRILARLKDLCLSIKAEGNIDLPALVVNDLLVELDNKIMNIYKLAFDKFVLELNYEKSSIQSKSAALMKVRQITSGNVYNEYNEVINLHKYKLERLVDLIDELNGEQLFIGYQFKSELDMYKNYFGDDFNHIGSGQNEYEMNEVLAKWNSKEIQILFGHPQSVGHGINLQLSGARHICFTSLPYDFEQYEQFYRRLFRQGNQSSHVIIHRLIAVNTIDEKIAEILKNKELTQNNVMTNLKSIL